MKITIVSDSHDNLASIYKMLDFIKKEDVEILIHCGDVCAPSVMAEIVKKFNGQMHLVFGNVDGDREKMKELAVQLKNLTIHGDVGKLRIDGKEIAWCHYPDVAMELAKSQNYDLVFYGHDHKPWEQKLGRTTLRNPGTLAGLFAKATFAIYDTKTDTARLLLMEKI